MTRVAGELRTLFLVVSLAAATPAHAEPWQSELILYGSTFADGFEVGHIFSWSDWAP